MLPDFAPPPNVPPGGPIDFIPSLIDSLDPDAHQRRADPDTGCGHGRGRGQRQRLPQTGDCHGGQQPGAGLQLARRRHRRHHLELGLDAARGRRRTSWTSSPRTGTAASQTDTDAGHGDGQHDRRHPSPSTASIFNEADEIASNWVRLQGPAGAASAAMVEVEPGSGAGFVTAAFDGSHWSYDWQPTGGTDGETYTVTARITDAAGQTATDVQAVIVDLIPPSTFTPTLSYRDGGGLVTPLSAGETVSATNPTLIVEWTASTDGAGLSEYLVSWTDSTHPRSRHGRQRRSGRPADQRVRSRRGSGAATRTSSPAISTATNARRPSARSTSTRR